MITETGSYGGLGKNTTWESCFNRKVNLSYAYDQHQYKREEALIIIEDAEFNLSQNAKVHVQSAMK